MALINKKIRLRAVVIVSFVLQIVTAVGLVGYLSFRNGQKAVNDLANDLQSEVGIRVIEKINTYLKVPDLVNKSNIQAFRRGSWRFDDFSSQERQAWDAMQLTSCSPVTIVGFGNPLGGHRAVERLNDGTLVIRAASNNGGAYTTYAIDALGNPIKIISTSNPFDSRSRPWYQVAVKAKKSAWTKIYPHVFTKEQLLALAEPIYDRKTGKLLGVTYGLRSLKGISKFLNENKISQSGQMFIMERDGYLVAGSAKEKLLIDSEGQGEKRLLATSSSNELIRLTAKYLNSRFGTKAEIKTTQQLEFTVDDKRLFVQILPLYDARGLDWLIVLVVPESDFMGQINANNRTTLILCVVALIVAVTVGILTARWVTKPILQLNAAVQQIAKGEWDKRVEIERGDEVGELARSFNDMAMQLQSAFVALRESESRLTQFLEAVPVGVSVHDVTGKLVYANVMSKQLLNIDILPEAHTGQLAQAYQVYLTGTNELYPIAQMPVVLALAGSSTYVDNMSIHHPEKIIPVEVWATPIRNENGKVVYAIAAFQDITLRKRTEQLLADYYRALSLQVEERTKELALALDAASAANRAKSLFLANMSHELRTPLNAILGFAEILKDAPNLTTQQQENIRIINRSGSHLLSLINDVLNLSKIEAGRITVNENDFDLLAMLSELKEIFILKTNKKGLQLNFVLAPDLPQFIKTDQVKLRQILMNLLSNAIKFTSNGGVTLRVRMGSGEWGVGSGVLFFEIEDTGVGISAEDINKLFQPFVQTEAGQISGEGTGLGLVISRKFVQLLGGDIGVVSQLGLGSTFSFNIKVTLQNVTSIKSELKNKRAIAVAPNQPTYRILVVDDISSNCEILVQLLAPFGFELKSATNGQEAIEIYEEFKPDLIFMDMRMPVMDGYQATQRIKAVTTDRATIIIAVTASAFEEERDFILSIGCDDIVCKPFTQSAIFEKIEEYLGVRFIYSEDITVESTHSDIHSNLSALRSLPASLLQELEFAAASLNEKALYNLITSIQPQQPALADMLLDYTNNFEYHKILEAIAAVRENS